MIQVKFMGNCLIKADPLLEPLIVKYDLPPLNCLKAFEAAARRLSFTKAADELNLTQAAISFQVRNLEESLGIALFVRHHRELELTAHGHTLMLSVHTAFDLLDSAKAAISGRIRSNTVTISAPISFSSKWLVPRLHKLGIISPYLELRVDANDAVVDLEGGDADLAIRYCITPPQNLDNKRLLTDTVFPVCSPDSAATAKQNLETKAELVLLHDRMTDFTWEDWFELVGLSRDSAKGGSRFSHTGNAIDAAVVGRGLALGRLPLVADDLAKGRLVRPFTGEGQSDYAYYLLQPRRGGNRMRCKPIVEWLIAEAHETLSSF